MSFAKDNLIDEIILTIVPKHLDEGIKLNLPYENFNLIEEKNLMEGIVQKVYLRKS